MFRNCGLKGTWSSRSGHILTSDVPKLVEQSSE
ncbi:hypothetical protein SNOG_16010 [Parastagonospora nodorum SN15]|uniref:Uncharacterized protein n=1 Tax=Phaeosphaeria nodorum (strain SN15 / ATCC MYA-4574 / FGSC 10173) TaxID=321614 RepID=Q0TWT3_PHANO|nr:hypothetical protein SNOG_16010 [Parastagonospora nodorum SN15]EAT76589.1 hypothetical protein SNOG_16010 [Parastagonospora nodorum SN15]